MPPFFFFLRRKKPISQSDKTSLFFIHSYLSIFSPWSFYVFSKFKKINFRQVGEMWVKKNFFHKESTEKTKGKKKKWEQVPGEW